MTYIHSEAATMKAVFTGWLLVILGGLTYMVFIALSGR
jgi:hypothetical protein